MHNHIYSTDFLRASQNYVRSRFNGDGSSVLTFLEDMQLAGKKEITLYKYAKDLYFWKSVLGKHFSECTFADVRTAVLHLQNLPLAESTKQRRKISLKVFFRWLTKEDRPAITSWIKTHMKIKRYVSPGLLLQPEDIASMFNQAETLIERTVLMLHAEAGDRIGEALNIKIKDVSFDGEFANLLLDGKTGPRPIPIYLSKCLLEELIRTHPFKDDPEAFLFLNSWKRPMSYSTASRIIHKLGRKAGITKPLNTHNFRHSCFTTHAKLKWSDSQLCAYHGLVPGSAMVQVYNHMAALDVKETILETHRDDFHQRDPRQTRLNGFLAPTG